jgi:hypothetical protein
MEWEIWNVGDRELGLEPFMLLHAFDIVEIPDQGFSCAGFGSPVRT